MFYIVLVPDSLAPAFDISFAIAVERIGFHTSLEFKADLGLLRTSHFGVRIRISKFCEPNLGSGEAVVPGIRRRVADLFR